MKVPANELIWILFDHTVFGGGKDSLVATRNRLLNKNFLEDPVSISYQDFANSIILEQGFGVRMGEIYMNFAGGNLDACRRFLRQLQKRINSIEN